MSLNETEFSDSPPTSALSRLRASRAQAPKTEKSDLVPNQYLVAFDAAADLTKHLEELEAFIAENAHRIEVASRVSYVLNQPTLKQYGGVFDVLVVEFIEKAGGVESVEQDRYAGPD